MGVMKHILGVVAVLFMVYLAIHAIVWATLMAFGLGPAVWVLIILTPIWLSNSVVATSAARQDYRRNIKMRKREAWRGY
tara:strand:- start:3334 stop:3570 length:237 start_codon:yes stop_codon:yes gene_type:complete